MNCDCCTSKAIQYCTMRKPIVLFFENEKLINLQHIANDQKMYEFYRQLYLIRFIRYESRLTSVWCGDRTEQLGNYYMYCYEYLFRVTGERDIRVGVFDWKRQVYVKAQIVCGIYPGKYYRKYGLNLNRVRTTVTIVECSSQEHGLLYSIQGRSLIENALDTVVSFFIHQHKGKEEELHHTIRRRFHICVSIRLVQFLKYAIHLQRLVKNYCYSNCTCGGFGGECICPVVINTCFREFPDAKRMHSDEVLFETPVPN